MERNPPFGEVQVTVSRESDGGATVRILMSEHTFDHYIQHIATKRGRSALGIVIEALRLEALFTNSLDDPDKHLYVMDRGIPRQLLGV